MNVLWLTNMPLPKASLLMNEKPSPFGGWLISASEYLSEKNGIELSIAFPKERLVNVITLQGNNVVFYAFPRVNYKKLNSLEVSVFFEKILDEAKPDIVHIFGTEYAHTLAMINVCIKKEIKTVISIQGLVSIYARHYMANLPPEIQNRYTFRDIIKQDNLVQQKKKFIRRGKFEIEALQKVQHVIGRTTWDKACTLQINPTVKYHYCNESLRDEFYKYVWDKEKCDKHSIFVSQGSYPIKGLHFMLEAMPLILEQYPDTKLYIAGYNITQDSTLRQKLKITSYGRYIKELINKNSLQNRVMFIGILDEKQMCQRYLNSNVFVCPSSIENSPNSLGEAMILGLPTVASGVGGVTDLIKDKEEGFVYQMDAPYILAYYICQIFASEDLVSNISKNAHAHAINTHDREENTKKLMDIYGNIVNEI